jgi:hypothetical protein
MNTRPSVLPGLLLGALLGLVLGACSAAPAAAPTPRAAGGGLPVQVDTRCRSDADCTVKNVGNCCGAFPACVNVASPTDPDGVMAQCRASGRMSVCGFPQVTGCSCVSGQCVAKPATLGDSPASPVR